MLGPPPGSLFCKTWDPEIHHISLPTFGEEGGGHRRSNAQVMQASQTIVVTQGTGDRAPGPNETRSQSPRLHCRGLRPPSPRATTVAGRGSVPLSLPRPRPAGTPPSPRRATFSGDTSGSSEERGGEGRVW